MKPTIETLKLEGVGPAPRMEFEFGPRLNLFTGDNGLGKTFLLDVAWWALTRSWTGNPALSFEDEGASKIEFSLRGANKLIPLKTAFDSSLHAWKFPQGRPVKPGLVIYARVDGGFSVWDPVRNYLKPIESHQLSLFDDTWPEPFHFSTETLWNGLEREDGKTLCNGLLRDWVSWQLKKSSDFDSLGKVLKKLKPEEFDVWEIGEPGRFSPDDVREIPTLELPYGRIPITHASAGVRRILGFAYLLVWALSEHRAAAKLRKENPSKRLIVLFDEVEAHLHPRWQRLFLPALLEVLSGKNMPASHQLLVSTHSPLVTASVETAFDEKQDRLFTFDLTNGQVAARQIPWSKQGDVVNWLVSEAFGLRQARSKEAESVVETAEQWMRGERDNLPKDMNTEDKIHRKLLGVLADHDPFWPRWIVRREGTRS